MFNTYFQHTGIKFLNNLIGFGGTLIWFWRSLTKKRQRCEFARFNLILIFFICTVSGTWNFRHFFHCSGSRFFVPDLDFSIRILSRSGSRLMKKSPIRTKRPGFEELEQVGERLTYHCPALFPTRTRRHPYQDLSSGRSGSRQRPLGSTETE